jgi:hypothetical protein
MVEQATDSVLAALATAFRESLVWPAAHVDPDAKQVVGDAHYQMLALWKEYIERASSGYVLTDLGRAELDAFEARTR